MAACDIDALLVEANTNRFTEFARTPTLANAIVLQLLKDWSGGSETTDELLAQACASQFSCLDSEKLEMAVALQLACNISA